MHSIGVIDPIKNLKKKKKNCSDKKCINTTSNYEYSTSKLYMYEKCDFY